MPGLKLDAGTSDAWSLVGGRWMSSLNCKPGDVEVRRLVVVPSTISCGARRIAAVGLRLCSMSVGV